MSRSGVSGELIGELCRCIKSKSFLEEPLPDRSAGWFKERGGPDCADTLNGLYLAKRMRLLTRLVACGAIEIEHVGEGLRYILSRCGMDSQRVLVLDKNHHILPPPDVLRKVPAEEWIRSELFLWDYTLKGDRRHAFLYSARPGADSSSPAGAELSSAVDDAVRIMNSYFGLDGGPPQGTWTPQDLTLIVIPQLQVLEHIARLYGSRERRENNWVTSDEYPGDFDIDISASLL